MERLAEDDQLCAALSVKGYERLKKFSWARAADETFKVFSEVLP
jgi:glycosyltransferase involved in cell wall biosynthesis